MHPITPITSVLSQWHCRALLGLASVAIVPIESNVVPPLRSTSRSIGGRYARHASVLCGDWICGGSLDFPAADNAFSRSSHTFSGFGPSVEITHSLGVRPVALPFRQRTPISRTIPKV